MPPTPVLIPILIKSCLLAAAASYASKKFGEISIFHLFIVVLAYQIAGSFAEWLITTSLHNALQDFTIGIPGMLIQIFGGWIILKMLAKHEF